jgi:hypothetical protein
MNHSQPEERRSARRIRRLPLSPSASARRAMYIRVQALEAHSTSSRRAERLDALVCYAVKANSNLAVLNVFARRGAGFDIVSAANCSARWPPVPIRKNRFLRRRQDRGRNGWRWKPASSASTSNRPRARAPQRRRRRDRQAGADQPARQSRTSTPRRTPTSRPASRKTSSASPTKMR